MASWPAIARRIRVPLTFAFAAVYLWRAQPTGLSILIGGLIVIPGLILRTLASGHVRKNEQLTTSGPYAYTRNPLYLGSIIVAAGFAVAARSWWLAIIMFAIFLAIYVPVIRNEEVFLRGRFAEFDQYARQVPALLPRLEPYADRSGKFSWKLYRQHREYNAMVGSVVIMAVLGAKLFWTSR